MSFTTWQLDAMRKALFAYRHERSVNGQLVPWKVILNKIETVRVDAKIKVIGSDATDFKEEALRRFANGSSTLQLDRLEDVKRFLVAAGFITEAQFNDGPAELHKLYLACANLARATADVSRLMTEPNRNCFASRPMGTVHESLFLEILADAPQSGGVFRVVENRQVWFLDESPQGIDQLPEGILFRREHGNAISEYRKGYGCLSTSLNLLHVFLHGSTGFDDDAITCIQVEPWEDNVGEFFLMRCGAETPALIPVVPELGDRRFSAVSNVYEFRA